MTSRSWPAYGRPCVKSCRNLPFDEVRSALASHLVLFSRDQPITQEQHIAFGRRFGELHIHPATPNDSDHPEILVVHGDDTVSFVAESVWRSDVSCDAELPMGRILRVEQIPTVGGDTHVS